MISGLFLAMLAGVPAYSSVVPTTTENSLTNAEKTMWCVRLINVGNNKIQVMKVLRKYFGLKEAKWLADSAPVIVMRTPDKPSAEAIYLALGDAGAIVDIVTE